MSDGNFIIGVDKGGTDESTVSFCEVIPDGERGRRLVLHGSLTGRAATAYLEERDVLRSRLTEAEGLLRRLEKYTKEDRVESMRGVTRFSRLLTDVTAFLVSRSTSSPPAPVDPVEAVLAVECPQCGSRPGKPCTNRRSFSPPLNQVCVERVRAALARHTTASGESARGEPMPPIGFHVERCAKPDCDCKPCPCGDTDRPGHPIGMWCGQGRARWRELHALHHTATSEQR